MHKGDYLDSILRSPKTVFTPKDVALMWQDSDPTAAHSRLNYYVRQGNLFRIRRGLYAKNKSYDKLELATRIFTPSYISFETVLAKEGLIFQYQTQITVASYQTRTITIDDQIYSYQKIKSEILTNPAGVVHANQTSIATKERAFLDCLYLNTDYHFDNTKSLDWSVIRTISPIYSNQRMAKVIDSLQP